MANLSVTVRIILFKLSKHHVISLSLQTTTASHKSIISPLLSLWTCEKAPVLTPAGRRGT